MEVSVESAEGLQRRIRVQIPSDRVEQAVDEKVRRVGQHAKVPGFRPGKIPLKVLHQRYGESARQEVTSEIIQSAYPEALAQVDLKPAGQPRVELGDQTEGLVFTAEFDVYPEIELKGLDTLSVKRPTVEVTDADIDKTIEQVRDQHKTFEPVERESLDGDQVTVDYVGRIDGETFEGGSGEDIEVTLGEGRFLPDLERALVGRKAGEKFEVPVSFPEDYGAEDLAGKTAEFSVELKQVTEPRRPELDHEFLAKLGIEEGGEAALREKVRESLRQQADDAITKSVKTQVMNSLLEANPIEVPASMVGEEMERMRQEAVSRMPPQMQENPEQLRELIPDDMLRDDAKRRVSLGLLLAEVIKAKELELDNERVDAKLEEIAAQYGEAEQVKQYYRSQPQMMQGIQAMVMEEQVVDDLIRQATVSEEASSLDALMNPESAGGAGA
ncbi:trigger factor [Spectribacter hydrogenoxidans]|uniref:Trigger factor n=1 Tax=Spectribacter hydrogenoxidans TaxID=3075608 RepID=A0ABU3C0P6_9GAMM|nr:trigger factor [Salinisphaera sp. W335]MDT0635130.1 trigger factor [Salinisphaera sp. W335]